jgi:hypothetical protein
MVVPIELLRIPGIAQRSGEIGHRNSRLSHKVSAITPSQKGILYIKGSI